RKVCFLDIDAHHSDGVQSAFYNRSDVLVLSLHESGETLFPGTGFDNEMGEGPGRGYTLNLPLPVGTYDTAFERVFREAAWPVIEAYDPDIIVIELGMDTLAGDPLAHLHLTNNVPADIVGRIVRSGKPVLAVGGGGYQVDLTVRGWALCWSVLCGEDQSHDLAIGLGGVMLENTDWFGGLRDRTLLSDAGIRKRVDSDIDSLIQRVRRSHFPLLGLD
ncbi:MAG: acetoin utilization protein AcuC, partial [Kiritimatiellia bacterium]|nr:acetoin utilization protein AcuC [Kiritimatiellia bacterium]